MQLRPHLHRKALKGLLGGLSDRPCMIARHMIYQAAIYQDLPPNHRHA
jgi:hypothetical protein